MNIAVVLLLLSAWTMPRNGDPVPTLPLENPVCNDTIHVSLDEICQALVEPDDILEGTYSNYADYTVELFSEGLLPVSNPVNGAFTGEYLTVKATHVPTGNFCWGVALIEDKLPPTLICTNLTINCFDDFANAFFPVAVDNCDAFPVVNLTALSINNTNICNGVTITRTFIAADHQGNVSATCTQVLTTVQPPLPDFPQDIMWTCEQYAAFPNIIEPEPLHVFIHDSNPATASVIEVNLFPTCNDSLDNSLLNNTNVANGGNGCPGSGLDDADVLSLTGSGVPDVALGGFCPFVVTSSDVTIPSCGATFTILRTWTILNWCTGQIFTQDINGDDNVQVIKVKDIHPPVLSRPPFTVGANIAGTHGCFSTGLLLPASGIDSCHTWTQRILTPIGEAIYVNGINGAEGGFIPFPGLPIGIHTIVYIGEDICGNIDTLEVPVTIADETAPVAICDEITNVSLGSPPVSELFAASLDDGSYDLCCLDSFSVRRMDPGCEAANSQFRSFVTFCCEDVGDTIMVVFRAVDCHGNYNDCMVLVEVEEKLPPVLIFCPPAESITCDWYVDSLEVPLSQGNHSLLSQFGQPIFLDNCEPVFLDTSVLVKVDQCQQGPIIRRWIVTDPGHNGTVSCVQTITVLHVSDWVVEFPADITVTCTQEIPPTGEPEIFFESCELVAVSYEDQLFTVVPDACFKIARSWLVINWCVVGAEIDQEVVESSERDFQIAFPAEPCDFDGDGDCDTRTFRDSWRTNPKAKPGAANAGQATNPDTDPDLNPWDGYIAYTQVIKVIDPVDPVVSCPPVFEVCILESDCDVTFELPEPAVTDCSETLTITASGELGTGLGPFFDVPPGSYEMTYNVQDNCNNQSICKTIVEVKDCKPPTPYCITGFHVSLGQDTVLVFPAEIFDAGSFDNCPGELHFSFSPDKSDSLITFDCYSIGYVFVNVYVTDLAGNFDFCQTFVFVDDHLGVCMGAPLIGGTIEKENGTPVGNVMAGLNGSTQAAMATGADGSYSFEVTEGGDYTVTPVKDSFPLNGVTTFDLVLISKHILGTESLNSPYKLIAADANRSGTVTTADLVAIRKLILQIDSQFQNNTSWRFVEKNFVFPNPANPFATPFPEVLNFNNLTEDVLNANFIGIKVGDVNLSATSP